MAALARLPRGTRRPMYFFKPRGAREKPVAATAPGCPERQSTVTQPTAVEASCSSHELLPPPALPVFDVGVSESAPALAATATATPSPPPPRRKKSTSADIESRIRRLSGATEGSATPPAHDGSPPQSPPISEDDSPPQSPPIPEPHQLNLPPASPPAPYPVEVDRVARPASVLVPDSPVPDGNVPDGTVPDGTVPDGPGSPSLLWGAGGASASLKGEDVWHSETVTLVGEELHFIMVADGHGGAAAAETCKVCLLEYCREALASSAAEDASGAVLCAAAELAFLRIHQKVRESPSSTAGCTLTLLFFNPGRGEVTCVNAGDSLALMAPPLQMLTADHRIVNSEEERTRILGLGGKLAPAQNSSGEPRGPLRAWPGGLAVARGIGDADCGQIVSPKVRNAYM